MFFALASLFAVACVCDCSRNTKEFSKQPSGRISDSSAQPFNHNRPPKYPKGSENLSGNIDETKLFSKLQFGKNKIANEKEELDNRQKSSEDQRAKKKLGVFSNLRFSRSRRIINESENEQSPNDLPIITKSIPESNKIIREAGIDSANIRPVIGSNSTQSKNRAAINSNNFQLNEMVKPPLPKPALVSKNKTKKTLDSINSNPETTRSDNVTSPNLIRNEYYKTISEQSPTSIYPVRALARPNASDYSKNCVASTSSNNSPIDNKGTTSTCDHSKKGETSLSINVSDLDRSNQSNPATFRSKRNVTSPLPKPPIPIINNLKPPRVYRTPSKVASTSTRERQRLDNPYFSTFYNDVEETATNPFLKQLKHHLLRTVEKRQKLKQKNREKFKRQRLENQVKTIERLCDKLKEGPSCKNGPSQELINKIELLQIAQRELVEADRNVKPFVNIHHTGRRSYYKRILRSILKSQMYPQNLTRDFYRRMPKKIDEVPPDMRNKTEEICREIENRLKMPYNVNMLWETEEGTVEVVGKYLNSDDFVARKAVLLGKCFMEFGYIDLAILSGPVVFDSQRKLPLKMYMIGARLGKEDPPIDYLVVDYIIQINGARYYGF